MNPTCIFPFLTGLTTLGLLALPLSAQTQLGRLGKLHFPKDKLSGSPLLVDVDKDGDLDAIVVGYKDEVLFRNRGDAVFSKVTTGGLPTLGFRAKSLEIAAGDIDGDGDEDIFVACESQNRLYLNDGKGNFKDITQKNLPQDSEISIAARFTDIDGDKDLDLIIANTDPLFGRQNRIYQNIGKGVFKDITGTHAPKISDKTTGMTTGDFDGNGTIDVVFIDSGPGQSRKLWLNDGKGKFAVAAKAFPAIAFSNTSVGAADTDKDGDLDLVFTSYTGSIHYFRNQGKARFVDDTTLVMPTKMPRISIFRLTDYDNDGDIDIVGADMFSKAVLLGNFKGRFMDQSLLMPENREYITALAAGDLDGDKDMDLLLIRNWASPSLYLAVKPWRTTNILQYRNGTEEDRPDLAAGDALYDFNGDGYLDLFQANRWKLLFGDGQGGFKPASPGSLPSIPEYAERVVLGDVNKDGIMDAWIGTRQRYPAKGNDRLFLGTGKGRFVDATFTHFPTVDTRAIWARLVDLDGDSDLDLILSNGYGKRGQHQVYVNNGKGQFSLGKLFLPQNAWRSALADIDGDGDMDLIQAANGQNQLWTNDGKGNFTNVTKGRLPTDAGNHNLVISGDIDGDGDLDLCFFSWLTGKNLLYLNSGKGVFTDVSKRLQMTHLSASEARLLDIDEDGDLDVLISYFVVQNSKTPYHQILINDGLGNFKDDSSRRMPAAAIPVGVRFWADIDDDGDLDYLASRTLYFNRYRQLHAPFLARSGQVWALDYYHEYGAPVNQALAIPLIGIQRTRSRLPGLGTLRIDPRFMVVGFPLAISKKTGKTRIAFRIPTDPMLIGQPLSVQALMGSKLLTSPGTWKLSNTVTAFIAQ